jgi:hypothetical protein
VSDWRRLTEGDRIRIPSVDSDAMFVVDDVQHEDNGSVRVTVHRADAEIPKYVYQPPEG